MKTTERTQFDFIAEDYDSIVEEVIGIKGGHNYYEQYKVQYLKPLIDKQRNDRQYVKVLDYGCGVGLLSNEIMKACNKIIIHGFDVSSESIKSVPDRLRVEKNLFTSNLGDLEKGYDVAILSVVLHHVLPQDRKEVMKNIYSRLRGGGILVIIEHNMLNFFTRKTVNNCVFDKDAIMLDVKESIDLMKNNKYYNVKSSYITFFPEMLKVLRGMDKYLGWLPLGAQFMVVGEKR